MSQIADSLTADASLPSGHCAQAVNDAFRGVDKPLEVPKPTVSKNSASAKDYGPSLEKRGLEEICTNCSVQPEKGDVIVIGEPPDPSKGEHPHGHIAVFNGKDWVSDYAQKSKEDGLGGAIPRSYYFDPTDVGDIPDAYYRVPDASRKRLEETFDATAAINDQAAEERARQEAEAAAQSSSSSSGPSAFDWLLLGLTASALATNHSQVTAQAGTPPATIPSAPQTAPANSPPEEAIPPGWVPCSCPAKHASSGRFFGGNFVSPRRAAMREVVVLSSVSRAEAAIFRAVATMGTSHLPER